MKIDFLSRLIKLLNYSQYNTRDGNIKLIHEESVNSVNGFQILIMNIH